MEQERDPKKHRARRAGGKVAKKKLKISKKKGTHEGNRKAFGFVSIKGAERKFRHKAELEDRKLHRPLVDRTPTLPPPVIVGVVGPSNVGKSTLIRSLVKYYTRRNLNEPKGPVTVVSGKNRRLTFIECPNDLNSMMDLSKVADVVLLLTDAHYGFEMETFEILNLLQTHGFPRLMGVLTHLDQFRTSRAQRRAKKQLKHRFWTDVFSGAKLFYLGGLQHGRYPRTDMRNLARFLSVLKFRPLTWRNTHSYLLADRMEDLTSPTLVAQRPTIDRTVSLYGYLHGVNLRPASKVHVAGVGDFRIDSMEQLADPCPRPDSVKRSLSDKQRLIYAPMSDIGEVMYDKDAVYVTLPNKVARAVANRAEGEGSGDELLRQLRQPDEETIDRQLDKGRLVVLEDGPFEDHGNVPAGSRRQRRPALLVGGIQEAGGVSSEAEEDEKDGQDGNEEEGDSEADSEKSADGWMEDDDGRGHRVELIEEEEERKWKTRGITSGKSLMDMVYGNDISEEESGGQSSDEEFFRPRGGREASGKEFSWDCSKSPLDSTELAGWMENDSQMFDAIRERFAARSMHEDEDGDWEDLEEPQLTTTPAASDILAEAQKDEERRLEEKRRLKEQFDQEYEAGALDAEMDGEVDDHKASFKAKRTRQEKLNAEELQGVDEETRIQLAGIGAGAYVRIVLKDIPHVFVDHFDPRHPLLVGGLNVSEDALGIIHARFKKHRWFPRTLKCRDPLVISCGWRRYQTVVLYSMADQKNNHRLLKYTPDHVHCQATFYGPLCPTNTAIIAFRSLSNSLATFRVSGTGVILELDQSLPIRKKLRLTGTPHKIFKNTAFVKDMFNSPLEVARFVGAKIRTVSGIRGTIKRALKVPAGAFRATFEDKILASDIVFLRTWVPIDIPRLYNPITNYLGSDVQEWHGMRTVGELRRDLKLPIPSRPDSEYQPIDRETRRFNPLRIPRKLATELPFADAPKNLAARKNPTLTTKRTRAVVVEPNEKRVMNILQQLNTIRKERERKMRRKKEESRKVYLQKKDEEQKKSTLARKRAANRAMYRRNAAKWGASRRSAAAAGAKDA